MIVLESAEWFKFTTQYFILDKAKTLPIRIDGFHSDVIRLQSQKKQGFTNSYLHEVEDK